MDKEIIITFIIAIFGSSSITAIVTVIVSSISKKIDKEDPVKIGLRLLLRDKIEWLGMKAIADKKITYQQKNLLKSMHDCYHNGLNGNGNEGDLMQDLDELEVVYPDQKIKRE